MGKCIICGESDCQSNHYEFKQILLDEKDRHYENTREIVLQIPTDGAVSEFPCFTPICKVNPNFIVEYKKNNFNSTNVASIFKNIAKLVPVDEFELKCWQYPKRFNQAHVNINIADQLGIQTNDFIPYVKLDDNEIEYGLKFINQFEKPCIIITPMTGAYSKGCASAIGRALKPEYWEKIIEVLSKKYTILYFTLKDNYVPIKNTTPIFEPNLRIKMSIIYAARKFIGNEGGFTQLAIAVGALCFIFVPTFGYIAFDDNNGYLFNCTAYRDNMWVNETKRVKYLLHQDYKQILNYF